MPLLRGDRAREEGLPEQGGDVRGLRQGRAHAGKMQEYMSCIGGGGGE
eukprot:CAMPEP_0181300924 /NCGR_PEP_ID=MMETSP1101-20121128/7150_1 /TAXON_ID=46948 /ORGANISM="Rhodomonas abbreviata, Strain Caron Lab Isolate" /LENGTH=47 /DNA_ID= /DNA_START= /DNA_END= /DNA_ORIENTATION=